MLNQATAQNLVRKAHWADHVQLYDGIPLFSWLDISPVDLCNRACVFCPRFDQINHPNQKNFLSQALAEKIAAELHALEYEGAVIFCGTGEPFLHPSLPAIVAPFKGLRVEIVTNGDRLTPEKIDEILRAGASYLLVSLYDGPHQVAPMHAKFEAAGYGQEWYALRDRWHGADEDFGLKLTNRAGTVNVGSQAEIDQNARCLYPQYCLTLDWDGRALLCPQDWHGRVVFGNVHDQSLFDIWTSSAMRKRRQQLLRGRAGLSPCGSCNAGGCAHGANHAEAWSER